MKALAQFLLVITLIVAVLAGYVIHAANIAVTPSGTLVESAADRQSAFDSLSQSAAVGSPDLILYGAQPSADSSQYVFVTYTIDLNNSNLLPVEWIQIALEPQGSDVLMIKPSIEDIAAFSAEQITLVLMTTRSASYTRNATLTYYVYGHEFNVPLVLGSK